MIDIAANYFGCEKAEVIWEDGSVYDKNNIQNRLTINYITEISLYKNHGPILGRGTSISAPSFEQFLAGDIDKYSKGQLLFGTHVVEVEVDIDTGKCKIVNYTASYDVGKIINRKGTEGQIEGGIVQGIGYGLFEQLIGQDGLIKNPSFLDYYIPTALDIPPINTIILEQASDSGPFGAKGIGEPPILPPMPAIANAIFDATGVQVKEIPITQEKLFWSLRDRQI